MATNKKISDLTELVEADLASDDVLPIVDVSAGTTHKVRKDTLASALSGVSSISATSPIAVDSSTGEVTVSTGTVPVASGGTGATSLTDGGVLLGSGTGAVTALAVLSDGQMIVGDGSTDPVAESGATLRTSIGVGTGDSPQFTAVNVGAATDTTVARASAGDINVEGNIIYRAGGTDVPVADGGTGASSLTDGGVLLGSDTAAVTAMAVLTDGQMIVGDGSGDPVAESGATLRTSIGVGTGDSPQFTAVNIGAATDTTVSRASVGDINVEGNIVYRAGGTDVPLTDGGTGASNASTGFSNLKQDASTSATGVVELLTNAELATGTDTTRAATAANIESLIIGKSDTAIAAGDSILFEDITDNALKRDTVQGILDLASGITASAKTATTSSVTIGSLAAGTKRITVAFSAVGVDTAGEDLLVQLGDSGGIETSGYVSTSGDQLGSIESSTAGFIMDCGAGASTLWSGHMVLTLLDSSTNAWVSSHSGKGTTGRMKAGGGDKALSAELTQVKITCTSGDPDAGSITIFTE